MFILSIFILFLDQLTKALVLKNLSFDTSIPIVKNIFHLTLVKNPGSAFGLFKNSTLIFIVVTVAAVILISRFLFLKKSYLDLRIKFALFMILGGALGNLIDRLRFGHVIDFLDFRIWPVFNIADACITTGAILIAYRIITKPKTKNSKS